MLSIKNFIVGSSLLFLSFFCFAEPANLSLLKKEVRNYYDSGLYQKELAQVITQAQNYINQQIIHNNQLNHPKKLAVVLDIDETSITNYNTIKQHDFAADLTQIHQDHLAANAKPIQPTLSLYREIQQQGVQVFFVTGRPQSELTATIHNLHHAGYHRWAGLLMRPNHYQHNSIISFKSQARAKITAEGYTIIASIGDQYSDLKGGFVQKGFKLPNPFYHLP